MPAMKYRPEIDGLRALALVPVVLFHAGYACFAGGYVGVDVFFVISGYLITSILDREMSAGTFSLADSYERRARRILPALWLVCLACIPFAWGLMTPEHLAEFAQSLVAVALFVSNVLFWQQSGYFDTAAELTPLLQTWSLAVEEPFYIVYLQALLVILPRSRRLTIVFLALACLASLLLAIWGARHAPHANYFLLPSRGFELGAGALLALTLGTHRPGGPRLRAAASLAGLLLILAGVVLLDSQTPFPGLAALLPVAGTGAIIAFSSPCDPVGRLLSLRPVVLVGLVSYSFYLWHQPVFVFARLWQY
ncbi:MAG: acyltransferase family protein [Alphaproteobacteria bacterium]|nr:acyltransferase family protein [Alphaproteobacteria bacterium]